MIEVNKNISWVEPNKLYNFEGHEITPPMENYCIAVDLEVEIMTRSKGVVTPTKTILVSWNSKTDGKENISFFQGTKHKYGDTTSINYLTSNPTTFGTFEEVKNEGTNECFGINSIDIQYNSYMVPEVTIEFTDIRGISLFSPEELRHQEVNEEGIGGMYSNDKNIAGSFFKCFFTFPYPKFKLMVKGFYGEPTTYELTVSDFRTRFDCNTGNFNATAKFVGYAFSLLNDVTMNALVVAPLCEYKGEEYWNTNVANGNFVFHEKTPMIRIDEVIKRTASLKDHLEKLENDSIIAQTAKDLSVESNKIQSIVHSHDLLYTAIGAYFENFSLDDKNNPLVDNNNKIVVFFLRENDKVEVTSDITTKYNSLKESIRNYGNNLDKYLPYGSGNITFNKFKYEDKIEFIKKKFPNYSENLKLEYDNPWCVVIYDGSSLNNQITTINEKNTNAINENQKLIDGAKKTEIIKALGFNPSIENITKLVLAHFETLMASIFNCTNLINKRSASSIGITSTDISDANDVGPFPRVDIETINNGVKGIEEGWLGNLPKGVNEQEVQLVEALLKAVDRFQKITYEPSQILLNSGNTVDFSTAMEIPVMPLDIITSTNPYGDSIDFTNISDFVGKVGLRMMSVLNLYEGISDLDKVGVADAYNFHVQFPQVGIRFLERLCAGEDTIDHLFVTRCLQNALTNEKIEDKWAWDSVNSESKRFMNYDGDLTLYDVGQNTKILPVTNFNWNSINSTVLLGNKPENMDYYVSTSYISGSPCNNIFKLDLNYDNYGGYASKMQVDGKPFKYVENLNLHFDATSYLKEFFYDDVRIFAKRFNYENSEVNYNPYEGSHLLPSERHLTELDALSSKSFKGSNHLNYKFDEFKYSIDKNKKTVSRKKGSFNTATNEIENLTSFTIPSFKGIKNKKEFTDSWSLFGQLDYYKIDSKYGKALAFLDSLKMKEEGLNMGGIRFDNYCADGDKNITAHMLRTNEPFMIMPYCGLLLLGGYFWREQQINGGYGDPLSGFIHQNRQGKVTEALTYSIDEKLFKLRQEIKDSLITEFEKWVDDSTYGFKVIQENFELKFQPYKNENFENQYKFVERLVNELKKNGERIEYFLWKHATDDFFKNYISLKECDGNIKLYNRETSSALSAISKLILKPCMVIKPTKYIDNILHKEVGTHGNGSAYLRAFLNKLKELYKKDYENAKAEPYQVNPINTSDHIKVSLYKYIKILYDKWLSGTELNDWVLKNFYEKHWYFIDSFYNKVGDRVMMDMNIFSSDIIYSQKESGFSLLSFISKSYASNRFAFHCVQNFMDLKNDDKEEKFKKMFDVIPYNEIDFQNINFIPSFILMYTYEYSSKLNVEGADFKSDSFDLDGDSSQLPPQIANKNLLNGYKIPAFGVSYGKQYQHYFKNIDVSTDNPIVTEEAIKTQFMIASMNSPNGENGKKINFLGQDLYTVYSNNSYTCTVKMMGCAWIQPLMYFQLNNIPMFRGAYLIQKVSHHIEPGNMETTFVGVRMSKTTTKLVDDPIFENGNDQTFSQENKLIESTLAEVNNDCEYAFYNPLVDLENASMPKDDLELTLSEYETKYQSTFNSIVTNKNLTVKQFLANIVAGEAGNQDDLGKQLVAVVLFNRYMHFGKNLTKMFWDSQHELGGNGGTSEVNIIVDIFSNSPASLKGKMTNTKKQIPILGRGGESGNNTAPVVLTMRMLKTMDGYCTTRGYHLDGGYDVVKEPEGWWHKEEYVVQHDATNGNWGHVFVAGAFGGTKEYWKELKDGANKNSNANPSTAANNLFNSIKRTVEVSQAIKCDEILMEKDPNGNADVFYITAKPSRAMVDIFDATVNTYYDYFSQCNWIVKNSGGEEPFKIRVKTAEKDNKEKLISIAKLDSSKKDGIDTFNAYEDLNKHFYMTLKKKYGFIDTNNKEAFKSECKNFNSLISKDIGWVETANNILNNNKISNCGGEVNLPTINGYQWDGDGNAQNKNVPTTPIPIKNKNTRSVGDGYNPDEAANVAKRRALEKSAHKCAKYVREAMQEAGAGQLSDRPWSACRYAAFMEFWGFTKVYEGFGPSTEGYTPKHGDIAVIAGTTDKKDGHIHIYHSTDKKWYSDFGANTVYCYKDKGRPYIVYRWKKGGYNQDA